MNRMRFTNVSEVFWQGHGAILPRVGSSAREATAEHA
jgi:hypothetical protein